MRTSKTYHQQSHQTGNPERIWLYALPPLAVLLTCLLWVAQTFARDVETLPATSIEQRPAKAGIRDVRPATTVDVVAPEAIESYIKEHPDVVVQFTSPDPYCSFCISSFAPFDEAALTHGRLAKFVRVQWSPWQAFPEGIQKTYQVNAVPAQYAFRDGQIVGKYHGLPDRAKFGAWLNKQFGTTK
jgi:hypothetical protein